MQEKRAFIDAMLKTVSSMGRDLSDACPIQIPEKKPTGEYTGHFETIRKDDISVCGNGTPVRLEEVIYQNTETGDGSAAGGAGGQLNEDAVPLFTKANHMLFGEIAGMFKTLVLSASLTAMDGQAFIGADAEYVIIPGAVTRIADDAFEGSRVRMLFGNTDAVRKYADDHGLIVIQTNLQ